MGHGGRGRTGGLFAVYQEKVKFMRWNYEQSPVVEVTPEVLVHTGLGYPHYGYAGPNPTPLVEIPPRNFAYGTDGSPIQRTMAGMRGLGDCTDPTDPTCDLGPTDAQSGYASQGPTMDFSQGLQQYADTSGDDYLDEVNASNPILNPPDSSSGGSFGSSLSNFFNSLFGAAPAIASAARGPQTINPYGVSPYGTSSLGSMSSMLPILAIAVVVVLVAKK